jgi:23S rRNA (uracil1939-C5)-methyltransferase
MTDASISLTLEKFSYGGDAIGRLPDGRTVFVPFALPGEQVRVRLLAEKKNYARAELLEVLKPSPERIAARCPHFGICGGCHYQHLSYASQLEVKTSLLADQLTRLGGISNPPIQPTQACLNPWNYRNHIQFHVNPEGCLGFRMAYSNQILPISACHLPEDPLNTIWPQLELEPQARLERITLRLGTDEDILLLLENHQPEPPELDLLAGISVVHLFDGESLILAGDDHIHVQVQVSPAQNRTFRVSASSFFQVNTRMAGAMVSHLLASLPNSLDTVLEIYCGVGLFSAFLAPRTRRLVGMEISPSACEDFCINLDEFDNVELYEAPAGQALPALQLKPDLILVDPPRAGLEQEVLNSALAMRPKTLAYISCDPATLARDARRLLAGGYHLQQVTPFDLFPQSFHIESISIFSC